MEKTIVVYFSATGATKRLSEKITKTLNADIFEIKPSVEYTEEDLKKCEKEVLRQIRCRGTSF